MDMTECIFKRKSERLYKPQIPPKHDIAKVLEAAIQAPSPKNRQPWYFVVLCEDEKSEICSLVEKAMRAAPVRKPYIEGEPPTEKASVRIMFDAPVLVLVFNRYPSKAVVGEYRPNADFPNIQAIGAAIQNMLLKATDLGMSSLWVCDILDVRTRIEEKFDSCGQLVAGVLLGYSANPGEGGKAPRKPLRDLAMWGDLK